MNFTGAIQRGNERLLDADKRGTLELFVGTSSRTRREAGLPKILPEIPRGEFHTSRAQMVKKLTQRPRGRSGDLSSEETAGHGGRLASRLVRVQLVDISSISIKAVSGCATADSTREYL
jgi:hypothetical protein